ncbi:MAG: MGMT family protein, partial [Anaerolineae bacterium]|nr:MGMT family protein [Anaerolineae bacterium]
MPSDSDGFQAQVYALVRRIPAGKVASYGWIGSALGYTRRARMVGQALARLPANSGVPWYRVVNSQRKISTRDWEVPDMQRELLAAEGVRFDG